MSFDKSIQMLTLVWNERRFVESKSARDAARRSVFRAATTQLRAEVQNLDCQNNEISREINRCDVDLRKYGEKMQVLDNMTQLATQSLEVYFQTRMENLRTFVSEQCRIISDGIQEEADHWKEIHAMLQQKLVVPGDLRSYGGGNGLPRGVKQSPNFSQIMEEDEEEEEDADRTQHNVSVLQARTLTPLITQTLKKARLLASKLSQDTSMIVPPQLNMSTTVHEETLIEEPQPPPPPAATVDPIENHVTLRDVSAIEREAEMETDENDLPNPDLSVSLLPFIPTSVPGEEEQQHNKSIASTISDKTFVKTSLKPFSSEEEEESEDEDENSNDETMIEESPRINAKENTRPLLLTADRSIRLATRPPPARDESHSVSNSSMEKPKIKLEKVSFREPLPKQNNIDRNRLGKTFLLTNPTYEAEKSNYVRPTIVINDDSSKLTPTASAESNTEQEKRRSLRKSTKEDEAPNSASTNPRKTAKSPVVTQLPPPVPIPIAEGTNKRRTTRRTTMRLLQENQNDNMPPPPPVDHPVKTRYQTRFSTRLAAAVITEETTTTTVNRRTTRHTSE